MANRDAKKTLDLSRELQSLLNRHSIENESDTPDFILAEFMLNALNAYTTAVNQREVLMLR